VEWSSQLSPRAGGWCKAEHGLQAIAWKQWLLKRRGAVTTLVEVLSPVLVISVLVLAYTLVDPEARPARIRVEETEKTINEFKYDLSQWANATLPEVSLIADGGLCL